MAQYAYDAWGNLLYVKDGSGNDVSGVATHIGNLNPFRYRGYYYDTDTGYYYLQSRYYDPQVGRFLNADGVLGANGDLLAYNMFAYCSNRPVMLDDAAGNIATYATRMTDGEINDGPNFDERIIMLINSATIDKSGISINMLENHSIIREGNNKFGIEVFSKILAINACNKYYEKYGEEFILTDECVAFEIEVHVDGYLIATNEKEKPSYLVSMIYYLRDKFNNTEKLYSAVKSTDISLHDLHAYSAFGTIDQALVFGYKDGIREQYRGTARDPWASER